MTALSWIVLIVAAVVVVGAVVYVVMDDENEIPSPEPPQEEQTYEIDATAGTGGTITPSGKVEVTQGGNAEFSITAQDGYHIESVIVDGKDVGTVTSYVFENVSGDHTISAVFEQDPVVLVSLSVTGAKTKYTYPETFSTEGMEVVANYSDGSTVVLNDDDYSVTPSWPLCSTDKVVKITYGDVSEYISITVKPGDVVGIRITTLPETHYFNTTPFSADGMVVRIVYEDGTSEKLASGEYVWEDDTGELTGILSEAKESTVTVMYLSFSESFTIVHDLNIWTADDLVAFGLQAVGHETVGKTFTLCADIDMEGVAYTPPGVGTSTTLHVEYEQKFEGNFDGGGHTIYNLTYIDTTSTGTSVGFIGAIEGSYGTAVGYEGEIRASGTIKDLTIDGATFTGTHWVGGIVGQVWFSGGRSEGKDGQDEHIQNCVVKNSTITCVPVLTKEGYDDGNQCGGIVGWINGEVDIRDCEVINCTITAFRDVGGIVGCVDPGSGEGCMVEHCTVRNVTVVQDDTNAYQDNGTCKGGNCGLIVGRLADEDGTYNAQNNQAIDSKCIAVNNSDGGHATTTVKQGLPDEGNEEENSTTSQR